MNTQSFQMQRASDAYTDINSVQALRTMKDKNQALSEISKQFESMMVRMMLKSMRDANQVFAEGNPLNSSETDFYQNMMDDQLALSLSTGRGIGLAETMQRQLSKSFSAPETESQSQQTTQGFAVPERTIRALPVRAEKATDESLSPRLAIKTPAETIRLDGRPEHFAQQLHSLAGKAAEKLNIEPKALLAQAALETGWGKKVSTDAAGRSSYNLFNIKADSRWQGDTVTVSTIEYRGGVAIREKATFRAYDSYQQSFDDYVTFIRDSSRYQSALRTQDGKTYIRELAKNGYATDPQYAEKINRIMDSDVFNIQKPHQQLAQAAGF